MPFGTKKRMRATTIMTAMIVVMIPVSHLSAQTTNDEITNGIRTAENQQLTMREWADLGKKERQMIIVASIESLFMAATAPQYPADKISTECLVKDTPRTIERVMRGISDEFANIAFTDVFLAVTKCYEADGDEMKSGATMIEEGQ